MLQIAGQIIYIAFAIKISISDLRFRLILNRDLFLFLVVSLILSVLHNFQDIESSSAKSCAVILVICVGLNLISKGKIGAGDLKLLWVISLWTVTITRWLEGLAIAWFLAGIFTVFYAGFFYLRGRRKLTIPFAPFIFLGFLPFI